MVELFMYIIISEVMMDLSILIPVYGAEKTLPRTLDSLLAQRVSFSWEIVAVNDGSPDRSLEILREYEKKAAEMGIEFRTLSFENGGVGLCRNRCLEAARGDAVLFLDADDLLVPEALSEAMKKKKETGAQILVFDALYLYADGSTRPFPMADCSEGFMTVEDYMLSCPCPWNKICDREIFKKNNLSFEKGILYEDLALMPSLATYLSKPRIYYWKQDLYLYYQSEGSIMRAPWSEKRLDLFAALEALRKNAVGYDTQVEYLFWLHLYRSGMWQFWDAGKLQAIRQGNALMKKHFPHWQKNPLVRNRASLKEKFSSLLFYWELFCILRIWKGKKA